MRFIVIAADRAATIATTIHRIWRNVGQPFRVARAASSAPVSANGSANTECSNLIISSTVRMRPLLMAEKSAFSVLNLFFLGFSCDKLSLAAALQQVKPRQSRAPMIEFRAAEAHESIRTAENSGIRADRETLSQRGNRAPEASPV